MKKSKDEGCSGCQILANNRRKDTAASFSLKQEEVEYSLGQGLLQLQLAEAFLL